MSPEIRIGKKVIARVPDETGIHRTQDGSLIYVDVDGIDADAKTQRIVVAALEIGGRRDLVLTQEGIGNSNNRRGDKKSPQIDVKLLDRPIRVSYHLDQGYGDRVTRRNPRWIRTNGER